jgi:hypothetical protein
MIQRQFIALPEEKYVLKLADLKSQRDLLSQLAKFEERAQKLSTEGGYAMCEVRFEWTKTNNNDNNDNGNNSVKEELTSPACSDSDKMSIDKVGEQEEKKESQALPMTHRSPPPSPLPSPPPQTMPTGARALAKFLSLITPEGSDNDSIDHLSDRVGDLFIPSRNRSAASATITGGNNTPNKKIKRKKKPTNGSP